MPQHHGPHRKTAWDSVTRWYDQLVGEHGSDYHQNVILPGALKLLSPAKGEKILDVGCGQGVFCRKLSDLGAEAIGIDASANLIKAARERSPGGKYFVTDAARLKMFSDRSFNAASCIMAIQNMEHFEKVFAETSRVLKDDGRFLIVISHPCFRVPRQSGWGFDEKRKLQYRRVDSYLSPQKIPIQMQPGFRPDVYTWTFHRPLSSYFQAFSSAGMAVSRFEEWVSHRKSQPGAKQRSEDRARGEIPLFLAIVARKVLL